jgi:hypothetical protein
MAIFALFFKAKFSPKKASVAIIIEPSSLYTAHLNTKEEKR